jgi:WD40 repeat protein
MHRNILTYRAPPNNEGYAHSGSFRLFECGLLADSGKLLTTFQGYTDGVTSAVFSPDGRRVRSRALRKLCDGRAAIGEVD